MNLQSQRSYWQSLTPEEQKEKVQHTAQEFYHYATEVKAAQWWAKHGGKPVMVRDVAEMQEVEG